MSSPNSHKLWFLIVILTISVIYTLSVFPGLEWHGGYFGRVYKTLYPESLPVSEYMTTNNPYHTSSYYWLVRIVGDIWLDDRFTIFVFLLLVVLGLIGVDKTAQVLGADRLEERILVLSLMAIGHGFRDNISMIVTGADFYSGTFAGVVAIWLFYFAFSGGRMRWLVICMLLLWSLNLKWAWLPSLIALTFVCRERLSHRKQQLFMVLLVLSGLISYLVYYHWLRPPGQEHVLLFDFYNATDNSEGNPFLDEPIANLKYFLMLGLGFFVTPPFKIQQQRVKTIVVIGALLWLFGGLYLTYAPDFLKIPYVVPMSFNRATQWPQYLLFLSICVGAMSGMRDSPLSRQIVLLVILFALYATFVPSRMILLGLIWYLVFIAVMGVKGRIFGGSDGKPWMGGIGYRELVAVTACIFLLATLLRHGRVVIRRYPDLQYLARYGVIGDNPSAKWVGVAEYIRKNTPLDAVILPIATYDYPWRKGLRYEPSLRTRTGRSMPLEPQWSGYFNYYVLKSVEVVSRHMERMIAAWGKRDLDVVMEELKYFNLPDYIVVENSEADWIKDRLFGYRLETTIGNFTILHRQTNRPKPNLSKSR